MLKGKKFDAFTLQLWINLCSKLWNISSKLSNISSKLWNIDYISYREHFLWFKDIVNHSLCNF